MFNKIVELAKFVLIKNKKHIPQIMFEKNGAIFTKIINVLDRDDTREKIENYIYDNNIDSYIMITESWLHTKNKKDNTVQPKKEALLVCEYRKDQKNKIATIIFKKNEKGDIVIIEEKSEKDIKSASSFWNVYLEKEGHEEREKKILGRK